MSRTQAVYYQDKHGVEPVNELIEALSAKRAAKIDHQVEEHLNGQPPEAPPPEYPITSQIEGELRELRVRFAKTRYRILYQRSANLVDLLHAFEKDTGPVPDADKGLARRRMADYQRRMDAEPPRPQRAVEPNPWRCPASTRGIRSNGDARSWGPARTRRKRTWNLEAIGFGYRLQGRGVRVRSMRLRA